MAGFEIVLLYFSLIPSLSLSAPYAQCPCEYNWGTFYAPKLLDNRTSLGRQMTTFTSLIALVLSQIRDTNGNVIFVHYIGFICPNLGLCSPLFVNVAYSLITVSMYLVSGKRCNRLIFIFMPIDMEELTWKESKESKCVRTDTTGNPYTGVHKLLEIATPFKRVDIIRVIPAYLYIWIEQSSAGNTMDWQHQNAGKLWYAHAVSMMRPHSGRCFGTHIYIRRRHTHTHIMIILYILERKANKWQPRERERDQSTLRKYVNWKQNRMLFLSVSSFFFLLFVRKPNFPRELTEFLRVGCNIHTPHTHDDVIGAQVINKHIQSQIIK